MLIFAQGQALAAGGQAWTLQNSAGQVRLVKSGISPIALTTGDVFDGGDWIETGPDGRAVLVRGAERIVVAPNSRIGLPAENTGPFATRILQTLGTILLTVEKQANQHFEVQTPYLTAVVKGTTFTVGIQGKRTVVHVVEGLVQVQDMVSGQRSMVRPGQTASVLSDGRPGVSVEGGSRGAAAPATAAPDAASGAVVIREALGPSKLDLGSATGGLVRDTASTTGSIEARGDADATASGTANLVGTAARATQSTTTKLTSATQTTTTTLASATQSTTSTLTSVTQPTTSTLTSLTQPTTTTLTSLTQPTTTTLTSLTQPTTTTLTSVVQPVVSPVTGIVQQVVAPVAPVVQPVTAPVTGLIKGLLK